MPTNGLTSGVADTLDAAKAGFRAASERLLRCARPRANSTSAFLKKSRRDMLNLSLSVDDP
jgi:hypothetical protein